VEKKSSSRHLFAGHAPATCCISPPPSPTSTSRCSNSVQLWLAPTTTSTPRQHYNLCYAQAKHYLPIKDFTAFTSLCLLFRSLPLDMLGGLAMPTRRSPDLSVQIFYLVLCSPPPRHARGLSLANLSVARLVGSYLVLLLLCVLPLTA
jgi:hypothetical protein